MPVGANIHYDAVIEQLARRRRALGVCQLTNDELVGLALGYSSKIEAQLRVPSALLLVQCFEALGLRLEAVPIPGWKPPRKIAERAAEARFARQRQVQRPRTTPAQAAAA